MLGLQSRGKSSLCNSGIFFVRRETLVILTLKYNTLHLGHENLQKQNTRSERALLRRRWMRVYRSSKRARRDSGTAVVLRGTSEAGACGRNRHHRAGRDAHKASSGVQGGKTPSSRARASPGTLHYITRHAQDGAQTM